MKKIIILCIAALFAVVSCNKEKVEPNQELTQITFNLNASHPDEADATKAVKTGWEEGDVIFVFFSGTAAPKYLEMKREGGAWVFESKNGLALRNGTKGTMRAIYLPFGSDVTVGKDGYNYTFSRTDYTYYLTATLPYTVEGGVVSGTFNMSWPIGFVQFSMPITDGINTFFREGAGQYTLSESHITPTGIASISSDCSTINHSTRTPAEGMVGYYYGTGSDKCILFSGVLAAGARGTEIPYAFTFVNNNCTGDTYDDATYYLSGTKTWYTGDDLKRAIKFPYISSSSWTVLEPDFVTVGGSMWAKWNVGATAVEGYGDYFSWGAIYPQYKYELEDYTVGLIRADLDSAHDVACQKLGSSWRMPTRSEIIALESRVTSGTWTTVNGVNGWLIPADPGHESEGSLFLPATGYWDNELITPNEFGGFWSRTFNHASTQARADVVCAFDFDASSAYFTDEDEASYGASIRPVHL